MQRGARAAKGAPAATISSGATEDLSEFASRAKAAWAPNALERAPPVPSSAWPAHASLPLTYHPVPDIA
jgi:hypothetical protein